jgi:hypothetical protein
MGKVTLILFAKSDIDFFGGKNFKPFRFRLKSEKYNGHDPRRPKDTSAQATSRQKQKKALRSLHHHPTRTAKGIRRSLLTALERGSCSVLTFYQSMAGPSGLAVCGNSPAEIMGSNPSGGMDVCLL